MPTGWEQGTDRNTLLKTVFMNTLFAEKYIPRNIVLNKEGKIIYEATGFSEEEFSTLKQVIEQELNN